MAPRQRDYQLEYLQRIGTLHPVLNAPDWSYVNFRNPETARRFIQTQLPEDSYVMVIGYGLHRGHDSATETITPRMIVEPSFPKDVPQLLPGERMYSVKVRLFPPESE